MATLEQITLLKNAYQAKINLLTDAFDQLQAGLALENWVEAETQYNEILKASATQYTVSGRTISKRAISQATDARNAARQELDGILGLGEGGVTYVDNGGYIL